MLSIVTQLNDFLPLPRIDFGKIWSLFKVTDQPRFKRVRAIRDKDGDPREPTWLGIIYCDQKSGKQYLVAEDIYESGGRDHCEIASIKEILSSKGLSHALTKAELERAVALKPADVDVENDMIAAFKREAEEANMVFRDLRERSHSAGTQKAATLDNSLN